MINENLNNDFIINNNVINYIRIIDINDLFKKARQYQNLNIEYKDLSLLEIIVQKFEAHDFFINTSNGKDPSILDLYNFLDSCVKLNDKEHKVFFVFKDLSYSESSKELINSLYDEVQKLFGPNGRLYEKIKFYLNEIIDINNNKANKDQSFMNIEFIAFNQFSQNIINDMDAKKDIQNGIPYPYFSSRINDNFKKFSLGEIDFFIEKYGIDINKEFKNATEFYTYIIKDLALKFFKDTNKELFDIENELDSKFKKNKEELVVKIEKIFDNYLENFIQSREEECKIIHNLKRFTSEFDELDNNINKQTCEKINKIKKSIHEAQDEIYNNLTKDNNPIEKRNEFYENLNKIIDSINFDDKNISYNLYTSKNNIKEFYKFINIIISNKYFIKNKTNFTIKSFLISNLFFNNLNKNFFFYLKEKIANLNTLYEKINKDNILLCQNNLKNFFIAYKEFLEISYKYDFITKLNSTNDIFAEYLVFFERFLKRTVYEIFNSMKDIFDKIHTDNPIDNISKEQFDYIDNHISDLLKYLDTICLEYIEPEYINSENEKFINLFFNLDTNKEFDTFKDLHNYLISNLIQRINSFVVDNNFTQDTIGKIKNYFTQQELNEINLDNYLLIIQKYIFENINDDLRSSIDRYDDISKKISLKKSINILLTQNYDLIKEIISNYKIFKEYRVFDEKFSFYDLFKYKYYLFIKSNDNLPVDSLYISNIINGKDSLVISLCNGTILDLNDDNKKVLNSKILIHICFHEDQSILFFLKKNIFIYYEIYTFNKNYNKEILLNFIDFFFKYPERLLDHKDISQEKITKFITEFCIFNKIQDTKKASSRESLLCCKYRLYEEIYKLSFSHLIDENDLTAYNALELSLVKNKNLNQKDVSIDDILKFYSENKETNKEINELINNGKKLSNIFSDDFAKNLDFFNQNKKFYSYKSMFEFFKAYELVVKFLNLTSLFKDNTDKFLTDEDIKKPLMLKRLICISGALNDPNIDNIKKIDMLFDDCKSFFDLQLILNFLLDDYFSIFNLEKGNKKLFDILFFFNESLNGIFDLCKICNNTDEFYCQLTYNFNFLIKFIQSYNALFGAVDNSNNIDEYLININQSRSFNIKEFFSDKGLFQYLTNTQKVFLNRSFLDEVINSNKGYEGIIEFVKKQINSDWFNDIQKSIFSIKFSYHYKESIKLFKQYQEIKKNEKLNNSEFSKKFQNDLRLLDEFMSFIELKKAKLNSFMIVCEMRNYFIKEFKNLNKDNQLILNFVSIYKDSLNDKNLIDFILYDHCFQYDKELSVNNLLQISTYFKYIKTINNLFILFHNVKKENLSQSILEYFSEKNIYDFFTAIALLTPKENSNNVNYIEYLSTKSELFKNFLQESCENFLPLHQFKDTNYQKFLEDTSDINKNKIDINQIMQNFANSFVNDQSDITNEMIFTFYTVKLFYFYSQNCEENKFVEIPADILTFYQNNKDALLKEKKNKGFIESFDQFIVKQNVNTVKNFITDNKLMEINFNNNIVDDELNKLKEFSEILKKFNLLELSKKYKNLDEYKEILDFVKKYEIYLKNREKKTKEENENREKETKKENKKNQKIKEEENAIKKITQLNENFSNNNDPLVITNNIKFINHFIKNNPDYECNLIDNTKQYNKLQSDLADLRDKKDNDLIINFVKTNYDSIKKFLLKDNKINSIFKEYDELYLSFKNINNNNIDEFISKNYNLVKKFSFLDNSKYQENLKDYEKLILDLKDNILVWQQKSTGKKKNQKLANNDSNKVEIIIKFIKDNYDLINKFKFFNYNTEYKDYQNIYYEYNSLCCSFSSAKSESSDIEFIKQNYELLVKFSFFSNLGDNNEYQKTFDEYNKLKESFESNKSEDKIIEFIKNNYDLINKFKFFNYNTEYKDYQNIYYEYNSLCCSFSSAKSESSAIEFIKQNYKLLVKFSFFSNLGDNNKYRKIFDEYNKLKESFESNKSEDKIIEFIKNNYDSIERFQFLNDNTDYQKIFDQYKEFKFVIESDYAERSAIEFIKKNYESLVKFSFFANLNENNEYRKTFDEYNKLKESFESNKSEDKIIKFIKNNYDLIERFKFFNDNNQYISLFESYKNILEKLSNDLKKDKIIEFIKDNYKKLSFYDFFNGFEEENQFKKIFIGYKELTNKFNDFNQKNSDIKEYDQLNFFKLENETEEDFKSRLQKQNESIQNKIIEFIKDNYEKLSFYDFFSKTDEKDPFKITYLEFKEYLGIEGNPEVLTAILKQGNEVRNNYIKARLTITEENSPYIEYLKKKFDKKKPDDNLSQALTNSDSNKNNPNQPKVQTLSKNNNQSGNNLNQGWINLNPKKNHSSQKKAHNLNANNNQPANNFNQALPNSDSNKNNSSQPKAQNPSRVVNQSWNNSSQQQGQNPNGNNNQHKNNLNQVWVNLDSNKNNSSQKQSPNPTGNNNQPGNNLNQALANSDYNNNNPSQQQFQNPSRVVNQLGNNSSQQQAQNPSGNNRITILKRGENSNQNNNIQKTNNNPNQLKAQNPTGNNNQPGNNLNQVWVNLDSNKNNPNQPKVQTLSENNNQSGNNLNQALTNSDSNKNNSSQPKAQNPSGNNRITILKRGENSNQNNNIQKTNNNPNQLKAQNPTGNNNQPGNNSNQALANSDYNNNNPSQQQFQNPSRVVNQLGNNSSQPKAQNPSGNNRITILKRGENSNQNNNIQKTNNNPNQPKAQTLSENNNQSENNSNQACANPNNSSQQTKNSNTKNKSKGPESKRFNGIRPKNPDPLCVPKNLDYSSSDEEGFNKNKSPSQKK